MTDFIDDMEELAADIALKAGGDIALNDKIDAFKALMPYYAIQMKNKGKDDSDDDMPTFDQFHDKIHAVK